jgi:carboxymethylenebutenolidase
MNIDREEIDIKTADGVAHAWTYRDRAGPQPAVVLYTDAFGVRPSMHEMAKRLAELGYFVLLPNVFYRAGEYTPFDPASVWDVPLERERLMALIHSPTPERVGIDGGAYLDAIAAQRDVRTDRIGVVGYCMGGRMALLTAGQHPDAVRAAASFHGGGLVTDAQDSPHRLANRVKASLYFGVADSDRSCTPAHQGTLASALGAAHVDYCIELYQGKKHGFAVSDHVGGYDQDAAQRTGDAWSRSSVRRLAVKDEQEPQRGPTRTAGTLLMGSAGWTGLHCAPQQHL